MCANGNNTAAFDYFHGAYYAFPEENCCACGKTNEAFTEAPSVEYSTCTHDPLNQASRRAVMYCQAALDSQAECELPQRRAIHCVWNPPFKTQDETEWLLIKEKKIAAADVFESVQGAGATDEFTCGLKCSTALWGCNSFSYTPAGSVILTPECLLSKQTDQTVVLEASSDGAIFYHPILPIEVPIYTADTCSHLPFYNGMPSVVSDCKLLTDITSCTFNRKCFWTTPNLVGVDM